ncbi:MAG: hypothetical protein HC780_17120 [Leptolyngbyaceae cyanobacterium CSU_1_3]|nr:hypothetical protein [Leptolyngbyaceae cyanobacterium CSU_1_3]
MTPDPAVIKAVERLNYRVTIGDVAAQAGLNVNLAQQGLLVLASETGGHLQVAESGDMIFEFPPDFRNVLRDKYFRLRLKEWWGKVWRVLFYLIRISFGIVLIGLIIAALVAIIVAVLAINSSRGDDDGGGSDSGFDLPGFWISPDFFWIFSPNYDTQRHDRRRDKPQMNFLESVFSFLFGDGNPNAQLEERRWQTIGTVIRNHRGAVIAEQIAPYLDEVGQGFEQEYEQYMLPVLARFNGRPEVSPEGQMVYHFPELQTTVGRSHPQSIATYLKESLFAFSQASRGQVILAASLGVVLLGLGGFLGVLVSGGAGKVIALLSVGYSLAYLGTPLIRYGWIQRRNRKILDRNRQRQQRVLSSEHVNPVVEQKLLYAQKFVAETVIQDDDLIYTTDRDLVEQDLDRADQIDAEWQKRLEQKD